MEIPISMSPSVHSAMASVPEVQRTLEESRRRLLSELLPSGHWEGFLSSSALSTATAVVALEVVLRNGEPEPARLEGLVRRGLRWLVENQNDDGGFGDTPDSPANISTTTLCWAALGMTGEKEAYGRAEGWLKKEIGEITPDSITTAISRRYGEDRTFSIPILTLCALAGRFGEGPEAWKSIPRLPFEVAALPRSWFRWIGLPVVSYALPALIAIGQVQHRMRPTMNPVARLARGATRGRTLRVLEAIQPESGGFIEATPLTSFVTMSLAGAGELNHPVTRKGLAFLVASARKDGSWPIDTNLATWVTTLSVNALGTDLPEAKRSVVHEWLVRQQTTAPHVYTGAPAGGWAWTHLSGGVPDGDDTAGVLLALWNLGDTKSSGVEGSVARGVEWLLGLQNRDGGIPTFCRGWGKMPFDRSSPDLTAHALRAWSAWQDALPESLSRRVREAMARALAYLVSTQRDDGSWVPLWFGNQHAPDEASPVHGTARVLIGAGPDLEDGCRRKGIAWLADAQNSDGGFGGARARLRCCYWWRRWASARSAGLPRSACSGRWRAGSSDRPGPASRLRASAWCSVFRSDWRGPGCASTTGP